MKKSGLRLISQIGVLIIILWLAFAHQTWGIEKAAPLDAYCPFGALESLLTTIVSGGFLQKIYSSNYILLGIFILMTFLFGRVFCGYFCPLWALQEWLRALGKKMGIKKEYELPPRVDRVMRYMKYVVLIGLVAGSYAYGELVFRYYDPFVAFSHIGNEFDEIPWAYILLGTIILLSLFTKSWWCRYFCPLGWFFGIIQKLSIFRLAQDEKSCTHCGICNTNCPMHLDIKNMKSANSAECISCMKCVGSCPRNSLSARVAGKNIKKKTLDAVVVFGFFGMLSLVVALPFWQTKPASNIRLPDGTIQMENLKGSNTLEFLIRESGIPLQYFEEKLHLPKDVNLKSKLKHIGEEYNIKDASGEVIDNEDFREAAVEYFKNRKE